MLHGEISQWKPNGISILLIFMSVHIQYWETLLSNQQTTTISLRQLCTWQACGNRVLHLYSSVQFYTLQITANQSRRAKPTWATAVCLKSKWTHNTLNIKSVGNSSSGIEYVAICEADQFWYSHLPQNTITLHTHTQQSVVDVDKATNIIYSPT